MTYGKLPECLQYRIADVSLADGTSTADVELQRFDDGTEDEPN